MPDLAEADPFVRSQTDAPGWPLDAAIDGLTVCCGAQGSGCLVALSQGDNSFAVFSRQAGNADLGSFAFAAASGIDGVQESDGADVTPVALPGCPRGLFITRDGDNHPENGTNFKFVPWGSVADDLGLLVRRRRRACPV